MRASSSLGELEERWKTYLGHIERVWFKAFAHYKRSPKWHSWQATYEAQRKADPLLSYLRNARGADEHTVADIVEHQPANIAIVPGEGGGTIRNLAIAGGAATYETTGNVEVRFNANRIRLLPVINRGVTYPVPSHHLSGSVDPENVISVAEAGLNYYDSFLKEAERFFVDKKSDV